MSELIPIKPATIGGEEINAVNARDLHSALGIKKDFSTWVKAQIERAGFVEGVDYIKIVEKSSSPKKGSGIQGRIDYFFTIPAAKEVCMMAQTPKGKEVRLYFIDCERKLKEVQAVQIPQSLPEALRLAANLAEQKMQLEAQVKEDAPKVAYYEQLQDAPGEVTVTRLAKLFGMTRTKLYDWLRKNRYVYGATNTPYQTRIEQGLLVLRNPEGAKHSDGTPVFSPYAHVTSKGAAAIYRGLRDDGLIERNAQMEMSLAK